MVSRYAFCVIVVISLCLINCSSTHFDHIITVVVLFVRYASLVSFRAFTSLMVIEPQLVSFL